VRRITRVFHSWGIYRLPFEVNSGYSTTNLLHRMKELRANVSVQGKDKILCHDPKDCNRDYCTKDNPCRYCSDLILHFRIDVEWSKLPELQKQCVFGKYGMTKIVGEDGNILTAKQAAKILGVPWSDFQSSWQWGVNKINSKVGL